MAKEGKTNQSFWSNIQTEHKTIQNRFTHYSFCIIMKNLASLQTFHCRHTFFFFLQLESCWVNVNAIMLHVIYTLSNISWAKWMGLILWTDPHCLMWKVMTCGCFKLTDHSASNGTRRHWNHIRTSSFTGDGLDLSMPLWLMDAHCTLALPQITFIWIIHCGDCSIITPL